MNRAQGSVLAVFLLAVLPACGGGSGGLGFEPFPAPPASAPWSPPARTPVCDCDLSALGQVEVRLHWTGQYLNGRAVLRPKTPLRGALLVHDPRLVLQGTSWTQTGTAPGRSCGADDPEARPIDPAVAPAEGCAALPDTPAGGRLELGFGLRHPAWTPASRVRAFAFPSLFAVVCPAHCRRPPAAWNTRFTMKRPEAPLVVAGPKVPEGPTEDTLTWEEPSPRLALVLYTPPVAELEVAKRQVRGYTEASPDRVLPLLHPFASELSPEPATPGQPRRLHVAIEAGQPAWGLGDWRIVPEGSPDQARLSVHSAELPAWVKAPAHAREGAVSACWLAGLDAGARIARLRLAKAAYLQWVQRRSLADPAHPAGPAPAAYWTLLFAGVLQRSADGPAPGDCDRLRSAGDASESAGTRPVVAFHEVLAALGLPPEVASAPQFMSVRVGAAVLRKDAVGVKLSNRSRISLWVPLRYQSAKGVWNHWVFLPSTGREQEVFLQHTGKPVDILIDPDHVTLVLPFGWTEDGPPEDLDEP